MAEEDPSSLLEFRAVMARLRAECGWKSAQTHTSLARYLLEETHETLEALEAPGGTDHVALREELGDLLLQVYFHAAIAEEAGRFTIEDVAADVVAKMRRRNPHVFGTERGAAGSPDLDAAAVNELWESVKATEKPRTSLLDGIAPTLPALMLADKVLDRRGRAGAGAPLGPPHGPTYVLVPSPFLGPSSWEPVAAWLRERGRAAVVVAMAERTPASVVAAVDAVLDGPDGSVVLVTHSNAGLYAPLLATRPGVVATVHVDAALPEGSLARRGGAAALVVPVLGDLLADRVDADGLLPPWTEWWPPGALTGGADAVRADQPRVGASYLGATVEVPAGWTAAPAAYLALGDTYAEERVRAASYGWSVRTLRGGHLHAVVDPAAVGGAVLDLASGLLAAQGREPDVGERLLALVAEARTAGVDAEQALRVLARSLAGS